MIQDQDTVKPIVSRVLGLYNDFPVKIYVFKSYADIFGQKNVLDLIRTTIDQNREISQPPHRIAIALPFGFYDGRPIEGIDIFAPRISDNSEDNPIYDSWTLEDGHPVPMERGTTCGNGFIVVASEESHRRRLKPDLARYLRSWPAIPGLGLKESEF